MTLESHENPASGQATRSGEVSPDGDGNSANTLASARKIAANRLNAKKCTGPRTQRGKSRARWNALKHGAYATQRLIRGEDAKAYQRLSERVFAETKPGTAIACMLVDQIIGDIWRLRRVEQAERAYLEHVRVANLARTQRALCAKDVALAPRAGATPSMHCRAEQVMLDAIVAPEHPYSSLEQVRRSLVRDVLQKNSTLAELQSVWITIGAGEEQLCA